ncbi:MAG: adenosine deaminase [Desulfuromonadales bacterium]|nr:adenosine deaminase [Desulfuromonadales bacterium]
MTLTTYIREIPKAELHIHIEGSLEPELMFEIAERNRVVLPFSCVDEVRKAYNFTDLQSFLTIYYQGMMVLQKERDFFDLTLAYLKKAHTDGVRHVEIFFDPQGHTERGIAFETVISGIHAALQGGEQRFGITSRLIMCFLRHLSPESAMTTLNCALPFRKWITAVGLDSSEKGNPPAKFATVFDRARAEGLLSVAHAGEEGPPDYIWQALDLLGAARIDHGVRCVEDSRLVERLRTGHVPLTVCPLSNIKLRVFPTLGEHNLKHMLDMGLCVTVNSDDPAYFGGYLVDNFQAVQEALNLDRNAIRTLAENSFRASFLTKKEKRGYLEELDRFCLSKG